MKPILHLLRGYFSMVPLQRWLNTLGLLLLAASAICTIGARNAVLGLLIFGVVSLALAPALAGGVALRFASTRSMLHLRPDGRRNLLIASTLAITLLALLITLPFIVEGWLDLRRGQPRATPMQVFPVVWTGVALLWISLFTCSRSGPSMGLVGLLPVTVLTIGKALGPLVPHPLWWLLPGLVAWLLFMRWYLRTESVNRPANLTNPGLHGDAQAPLLRFLEPLIPDGESSRSKLQQLYLLGTSVAGFAVSGLWVALIFLGVNMLVTWINSSHRGAGAATQQLLFMLPFLGFFMFSIGQVIIRNARRLWLRERMDRSALFRTAEWHGLRACLATWSVTAALVLAVSLAREPSIARFAVLFVAAHTSLAICLFYGGMAMTRTWTGEWIFRNGLLVTLLGAFFMVYLYQLKPELDASPATIIRMIIAALVFAAALRAYAASAWKNLDWRVARLPWSGARANG